MVCTLAEDVMAGNIREIIKFHKLLFYSVLKSVILYYIKLPVRNHADGPEDHRGPRTVAQRNVFVRSVYCALAMAFKTGAAIAAQQPSASLACGSLENAYGPFDYTNASHRENKLSIVEQYHFTPEVETLKSGSTGSVAHDLDYTLRAFPNHHRALYAMLRYQLKRGGQGGAGYSMECYFDRALRQSPGDGQVYILHGIFLHKKGAYEAALEKYRKAEQLLPDSEDVHYNLGLLYVDTKKYELARQEAEIVYSRNYPLPGLRNKLKRLGYYK